MRSFLRVLALFIAAVVLSLVAELVLAHFIIPNKPLLIVRMFRTPESSPDWPNLVRQWNRTLRLQNYLISPLSGVIVGALIGWLQKRHAVLLALVVGLPDTLFVFWSQRRNLATMSHGDLAMYLLIASLPFLSTAFAAWVFNRIRYGSHGTGRVAVATPAS